MFVVITLCTTKAPKQGIVFGTVHVRVLVYVRLRYCPRDNCKTTEQKLL